MYTPAIYVSCVNRAGDRVGSPFDRWLSRSAAPARSASGDGGQDRDAARDRVGREPVQEADVLLRDEHVQEAAKVALPRRRAARARPGRRRSARRGIATVRASIGTAPRPPVSARRLRRDAHRCRSSRPRYCAAIARPTTSSKSSSVGRTATVSMRGRGPPRSSGRGRSPSPPRARRRGPSRRRRAGGACIVTPPAVSAKIPSVGARGARSPRGPPRRSPPQPPFELVILGDGVVAVRRVADGERLGDRARLHRAPARARRTPSRPASSPVPVRRRSAPGPHPRPGRRARARRSWRSSQRLPEAIGATTWSGSSHPSPARATRRPAPAPRRSTRGGSRSRRPSPRARSRARRSAG